MTTVRDYGLGMASRRPVVAGLLLAASLVAAGCSGGAGPAVPAATPTAPAPPPSSAPATQPAAAGIGPGGPATGHGGVPATFRQAPFDRPRRLTVPAGWAVSVYTRIPGARFLAFVGTDLLVSQPGTGSVQLVRRQPDGTGRVAPG